jgi:hypothetical protein
MDIMDALNLWLRWWIERRAHRVVGGNLEPTLLKVCFLAAAIAEMAVMTVH